MKKQDLLNAVMVLSFPVSVLMSFLIGHYFASIIIKYELYNTLASSLFFFLIILTSFITLLLGAILLTNNRMPFQNVKPYLMIILSMSLYSFDAVANNDLTIYLSSESYLYGKPSISK